MLKYNQFIQKQISLLIILYAFVISINPYTYGLVKFDISKAIILFIIPFATYGLFLNISQNKTDSHKYIHLLFIIIFTIAYSIFFLNRPFRDVSKESYLFLTFALLILGDYSNRNNKWIKILSYAGAFSGLMAIITFFKWVPIDTSNPLLYEKYNLERTADIIDGNIGIIGTITSLFLCFEKKNSLIVSLFCFFLSFSNVLLGAFRIYVFASLFMCLLLILGLKTKFSSRINVFFIIAFFIALTVMSDPAGRYSAFAERLVNIVDKSNSFTYRMSEVEIELDLIKKSPLLGNGWGIYNDHYVAINLPEYGHNMYTSWAARIGIPLTVIVVLTYFYILKQNYFFYKHTNSENSNQYYLALISIIGFLVIIFFNDLTKMSITFPLYALLWNSSRDEKSEVHNL